MCVDPVSMGVTAVSTGLSIMGKISGQADAAANRDRAMDSALSQTIPSINQSLAQVYNSNSARANQERDAAATESFDILRSMAEAKGTATVAAGEAGVGGVSFANILSDFETRESLAKGKLDYNVATKVQQIGDDNMQAKTRAQAQINSAINAAVNATPVPSTMSVLAGIGADVGGAGLKIADKIARPNKDEDSSSAKVDPATGKPYRTDRGNW